MADANQAVMDSFEDLEDIFDGSSGDFPGSDMQRLENTHLKVSISLGTNEISIIGAGMSEWLDHLTLVRRILGSKPPSDLSQSSL